MIVVPDTSLARTPIRVFVPAGPTTIRVRCVPGGVRP